MRIPGTEMRVGVAYRCENDDIILITRREELDDEHRWRLAHLLDEGEDFAKVPTVRIFFLWMHCVDDENVDVLGQEDWFNPRPNVTLYEEVP